MSWLQLLAVLVPLLGLLAVLLLRGRRPELRHAPARKEPRTTPTSRPAAISASTAGAAEEVPHGIVVGEMDTNFYGDVASLLEKQLAENPARTDLYMTLLELHHAAARRTPFLRAAKAFAARARSDQWSKVSAMGRELGVYLEAGASGDPPPSGRSDDAARPLESTAAMPGWAMDQTAELPAFAPITPPAPEMPGPPEVAAADRAAPGLRHYEELPQAELEQHLSALRDTYLRLRRNASFLYSFADAALGELGGPTPLYHAAALSSRSGGAQIYFKREDTRPADAALRVNALGQALVTRFCGRRRLICGSERSAPAYAAAARRLGLQATLYVPAAAEARLARELATPDRRGPELIGIPAGNDGTGDPRRAALAAWLRRGEDALYVTGLEAGPDPYPAMVSDFLALTGHDVIRQLVLRGSGLPAALVCSAETGLASIGFCQPFLERPTTHIAMVNPPGPARQPAAFEAPPSTPIREQRWLAATGRVAFVDVDDAEMRAATQLCEELEHLFLKAHNARAVAQALRLAKGVSSADSIVVMLGSAPTVHSP